MGPGCDQDKGRERGCGAAYGGRSAGARGDWPHCEVRLLGASFTLLQLSILALLRVDADKSELRVCVASRRQEELLLYFGSDSC